MNETPAWILGRDDDETDDGDTDDTAEPAAMVPSWLVHDE